MGTCEHRTWRASPRGPRLPDWYVCETCGVSASEFEWEAIHQATAEQTPAEIRGQQSIMWTQQEAS